MMKRSRIVQGFTLVELLVVAAVVALILTLAAPSFQQFILLQRLKSINAQVVTDLQWARSEAVSRGQPVRVRFQSTSQGTRSDLSCYIIYIDSVLNATETTQFSTPLCDCKSADGSQRCPAATTRELKTVQLSTTQAVMVAAVPYDYSSTVATAMAQDHQAFDPRTGGVSLWTTDTGISDRTDFTVWVYLNESLKLGNQVGRTGRVQTCKPAGSTLAGEPCR
jgi:type IV fimbrial biogenesis protein FimT